MTSIFIYICLSVVTSLTACTMHLQAYVSCFLFRCNVIPLLKETDTMVQEPVYPDTKDTQFFLIQSTNISSDYYISTGFRKKAQKRR